MIDKETLSNITRESLINYTLLNLQTVGGQMLEVRNHIAGLCAMEQDLANAGKLESEHIAQFRRIAEYSILIGLISNDLSVAYRIYLRAEDSYEVQYAIKQIVIILREGFNQIYNVFKNKKGKIVTEYRNDSIWKKEIGGIVQDKLPELKNEYLSITNQLDNFDDSALMQLRDPRNLFVHYDRKPCEAYDAIQNIHIEQISQKAIPFMEILLRMMNFNHLMIFRYLNVITQATVNAFEAHTRILENLRDQQIGKDTAFAAAQEGLQRLEEIKIEYERNQNFKL